MASAKRIKIALLGIFTVFTVMWLISSTFPKVDGTDGVDATSAPHVLPNTNADDYVGSESCKACHEDEFKAFAETKHAKLATVASWKDKVQGCESCHGPGKSHMDDPSVQGSIISFKDKSSKQISESCLTCHSGNEGHSKFRRSDHWRNNVGCTDCHTAHGADSHVTRVGSITETGIDSDNKPGTGLKAMLKMSEPQLCLKCHTETKAEFSQPFHHKVLKAR